MYSTYKFLRTPKEITNVYINMVKTANLISESMKDCIFVHQAIVVSFGAMCNFILAAYYSFLTRLEAALCVLLSVSSYTLWLFILVLAACVITKTNKVHLTWRRHRWKCPERNLLMRMTLSYVLPFRIRCGFVYYLSPNRTLLFTQNIIIVSGKFLLAFKPS